MKIINMHQAKTQLSKLVNEALDGEEVIIAKSGKPVVKLVPYKFAESRKPGQFKGKINIPDNFNELSPEILKLFYGDLADLE